MSDDKRLVISRVKLCTTSYYIIIYYIIYTIIYNNNYSVYGIIRTPMLAQINDNGLMSFTYMFYQLLLFEYSIFKNVIFKDAMFVSLFPYN